MRLDRSHALLVVGVSIAAGWIAWSGEVLLLPAALAFAAAWGRAPNRQVAGLAAAGYFLAASRGLPQGVATFYATDLWPGIVLWIVAAMGFVAVHAALWSLRERQKPLRILYCMVLMALPPFGIVGWAHPITAAGVILPGWGWWGLAVSVAAVCGLATRFWPGAAIVVAGLWLWSAIHWSGPDAPKGWHGVDLNLGASLGREAGLQRQRDLIATFQPEGTDDTIVVLPESTLGNWTPTVERLWTRALAGSATTVIAGASLVNREGYDNVLVIMTGDGARVLYRERMPVPGSMWQPWLRLVGESGGVRAAFFENPVVTVSGRRIAPLICYEQLLVWPVLQSMLHDPDIIIGVGNGWWTAGTSIVAIQRASTTAWASLFSKPLVLSFNH